ncbi:MAG TPA: MFS transporter, partial [Flavisolibacter sp.]|nr:MFS transporter [Flavisolibacter sp.]
MSVLIAALLYPATLLLLASVEYTWQLVIGLLIFGFLANLINIAMNTQAVSVEKIYGRSIMASFHGLWSLAGFTGAVIGSLFVSNGLSPMWQFSIISIVAFILVWSSHKYTLDDYNVKKASSPSLFTRPDKYILTLGLIAFCCMLCEGAMADWSGVYFQKVVTTKGISTTIGYVAFTFTMAGGRFLGDWVVAKIGVRQVLKFSGVLIFIGLMVAVLYPSAIVATAGFLLVGLGVSSVVPIIYSLAGKSEHMPASVALSAVSTISFL